MNCILEANHSAQKLLEIISENFFHFRDESLYANQSGTLVYYYICTVPHPALLLFILNIYNWFCSCYLQKSSNFNC